MKIGIHGQITTEEARILSKQHLGRIAHGEDLAEDAKQTRSLATMADLAQDYFERHAKKKRAKSLLEDVMSDSLHGLRFELSKSLHKYNSYRPHFNLNGLTPLQYLQGSYPMAS